MTEIDVAHQVAGVEPKVTLDKNISKQFRPNLFHLSSPISGGQFDRDLGCANGISDIAGEGSKVKGVFIEVLQLNTGLVFEELLTFLNSITRIIVGP